MKALLLYIPGEACGGVAVDFVTTILVLTILLVFLLECIVGCAVDVVVRGLLRGLLVVPNKDNYWTIILTSFTIALFSKLQNFRKYFRNWHFFRKFSKILSNFESIFEKSVNFESIFENFVISKKMSMVDEVTIRTIFIQQKLCSTSHLVEQTDLCRPIFSNTNITIPFFIEHSFA